ncbi:MAG: hypothetical protein ACP5FH_07280 [Terracidiphilus sp.]
MIEFAENQVCLNGAARKLRVLLRIVVTSMLIASATCSFAQKSAWVRPTKPGDPLIWGRRDGIVFGLFSPGGIRGPRGLIRIGLYTAPNATSPELLNFVAVEPVVQGAGARFDRMAFSELEMSELDPGQRGKRMGVDKKTTEQDGTPAGMLETLHAGKAVVERLTVRVDVERFTANGAHVYVIASIDSDHPSELRLRTYAESDSPPIDELTLTATMGNYERLRLLWLNDSAIDSRKLFGFYAGDAFVENVDYPLGEMLRSGEGDAIVFCTSSETDPGKTPGNDTAHWVYTLPKLTQYWRVPGRDVEPNLRVRVNARRVYWASKAPVLGGIAFENFEVRERFIPGQSFIFGITRDEPWTFYHGPYAVKPHPADQAP